MAFSFRRQSALKESSINLDLERVQPFLEQVASLVSTEFGQREVAGLVSLANSLAVEEEAERDFQILYEGRPSTLRIRFFMDDIDEAGIYIFSVPSLAEKVSLLMKQIIDEED